MDSTTKQASILSVKPEGYTVNTYIALFRGINVGGKNILPMKKLVVALESMGCTNVKTYIQSGNVVFQNEKMQSDKIAQEISSEIKKHHEFEPKVLLLKQAELQQAVDNNPFDTKEGRALHFFFLDSYPKHADLERLVAVKSQSEKFKLIDEVFYLYAPEGIGRSKLAAKVEQCLGVPVTARNWNTVNKLFSMVMQA
jgi:uncharacterized protein (DUF1697 family)